MPSSAHAHGLIISLILLSILLPNVKANVGAASVQMMMMMNESRRKLGSFQICALCTCCGGPKGICLPSSCCYAINCNIPNRPFGFCSFTPKTCGVGIGLSSYKPAIFGIGFAFCFIMDYLSML